MKEQLAVDLIQPIAFACLAVAACAIVRYLWIRKGFFCKKAGSLDSYEKSDYLLTENELRFHKELENAVPKTHTICIKVRLEDLIGVDNKIPFKERSILRNRVKSRHIDFVLVERSSSKIVGGLELDDRSHKRKERIERDRFINELADHVGFRLERVQSASSYKKGDLESTLARMLN